MQLRFETTLLVNDYVATQGWRTAVLLSCPLHPQGGCSFARHGTYTRSTPVGMRIPRWYCPQGHCTFSLLPDFLACQLPGSLTELEFTVLQAEQSTSIEQAANTLRMDDISLPSAVRWVRRRVKLVQEILACILPLMPSSAQDDQPSLTSLCNWCHGSCILSELRKTFAAHLHLLPPPLGFVSHSPPKFLNVQPNQHNKGPDPPICKG